MIPALIGTGTVLFLAIVGATWTIRGKLGALCERQAGIEAKLETFQTKTRCGEKRISAGKDRVKRWDKHMEKYHPGEISGVAQSPFS
jgi:hypothetical protein